jgi:hypothetical protein
VGKAKEELDKQFAELESPKVSPGAKYLINMFRELSSTRQSGMNGMFPITYLEMRAYSELTDYELEPWEVEVIKNMDSAFMEEIHKIINKDT